jgi:hypothetical protein
MAPSPVIVIPATGKVLDEKIKSLEEEQKKKWKEEFGIPDEIADRAWARAEGYLMGVSRKYLATPELQEAAIRSALPKAIEDSTRWIRNYIEVFLGIPIEEYKKMRAMGKSPEEEKLIKAKEKFKEVMGG